MSRGSLSLIISVIVAVVLVIKTSGAPENQKDSQFSEPNFSASENSLAADTYSYNSVDSDPSIVALEQRYQDLLLDDEVPAEQKIEQLMAVGNALMCRQIWDASARAFNAALMLQRQQAKLNPLGLVITLTRLAQVKSVAAQSIDDSRELIIEATRLLRDHQPAPKAIRSCWVFMPPCSSSVAISEARKAYSMKR